MLAWAWASAQEWAVELATVSAMGLEAVWEAVLVPELELGWALRWAQEWELA